MVKQHLEYASVIWSPLYKKDKITLGNVICRATRLVPALKGLSYPERLKHIGLPTLEYRRERADDVEVFKILNNIDVANKDKLFKWQLIGTHSNLSKDAQELRANNFSLRVIDKWNALHANTVLSQSADSFKSRLNKHWHGHHPKFEAACYTPGEPRTIVAQGRNASSQATGWST